MARTFQDLMDIIEASDNIILVKPKEDKDV